MMFMKSSTHHFPVQKVFEIIDGTLFVIQSQLLSRLWELVLLVVGKNLYPIYKERYILNKSVIVEIIFNNKNTNILIIFVIIRLLKCKMSKLLTQVS